MEVNMKRTILFSMLVFCAATLVLAQGNNRWKPDHFSEGPRPYSWKEEFSRNQTPRPSPESATVSGNLTIARGMIAVVSGETTWLVRGINRYIGFIDGLKEGAEVTLEGYAMPASRDKNIKSLHVQKMTLNGKDYELARPRSNEKPEPMHQQRQRGRLL